jgi:hypothetical protein
MVSDGQKALDAIRAKMFPAREKRQRQSTGEGFPGNDRELLERMSAASNGSAIEPLYGGDTNGLAGNDSAADLALCDHLAFWCGPDPTRIDRLFRGSGLMRDKWDSPRGETTYGARTIEKALDGRTEFYGTRSATGGPSAEEPPTDGAPPETDSRETPAVRFTPSDELLRKAPPKPDWMWEDALARGAVSLFAGKPKVGKSTLTYGLVEAAANREADFLGRAIHGGPVVYASEEGQATLGSTFPRHPEVHLATRESAWPKPAWRDLVTDAAATVREVGAVLCVIDTFSFWNNLGPDAEKDSGSVQPLLDALVEITQTGCAVWLAHHHRKGGSEDGDALRGTTAIAGGVDCFCELEKIEDAPANHRRLVVTPRWTMPPVLVIEYDEVLGYRVIGQAADREQSGQIGWTERLLAPIPETGDGITLADLAEVLGADRRKWHTSFTKLIDDGFVTRTGEGNRYDPYRHLRAAVPHSRPEHEDGWDGEVRQPSSDPRRPGGGDG